MMGLLGTGPRATPLRVAPGKARGHVVYSQNETQHHCRPAAYHVTESDGYPHSAAGALASAQARPILLGASGPFDDLAHEPQRHGVQLACVVFPGRSGGPGGFNLRLAGSIGTTVGQRTSSYGYRPAAFPSHQLARVSGYVTETWQKQGKWCTARSTAGTGADGLAAASGGRRMRRRGAARLP